MEFCLNLDKEVSEVINERDEFRVLENSQSRVGYFVLCACRCISLMSL